MGNCGAKPKTKEGLEPIEEEPVMNQNELKNKGENEEQENKVDTINKNMLEEIPHNNASDEKSLHNLLEEKEEEPALKLEATEAEASAMAEVVKLEVVEPKELKVIQEENPNI